MTDPIRATFAEEEQQLINFLGQYMILKARAALAQPTSPTDADHISRAAELLQQRHPAPVAVSDDQLDLVVIAIQALTPHQPGATTHDLYAVDRGREILRQSLARWLPFNAIPPACGGGGEVKERPILFSGPMVRAILKGRKTQTRRIVKLHPASQRWRFIECAFNCEDSAHYHAGFAGNTEFKGSIVCVNCPYGKPPDPIFKNPGDRLWVRETWALVPATAYRCSTGVQQTLNPGDPYTCAVYRAEWERSKPGSWRPSIFMPRWASRITLEITGVRVERLQQISDADALAEGCSAADMRGDSLASVYARLWESIHGPGSWDANPWVWVVEFRRLPATDAPS